MGWFLIGLPALFFLACSGAEQNLERKWEVKVTKQGEPKMWIFRPDGSKQCGEAPPSLTPELATETLKRTGVLVYQARRGTDGLMRTAVCGASTGNTVEVEIGAVDFAKAKSLGYQAIKTK